MALSAACSGKESQTSKTEPASGDKAVAEQSGAGAGKAVEPGPAAPPSPPPGPRELVSDPGDGKGVHLWSLQIGGLDKDTARAVAIDAAGNVAITGYVTSGADFGDGKAVETQKADAYVARYGPEGQLLWVHCFGGRGDDIGNGVAIDAQGNIIVVGLFSDKMTIGEQELGAEGSDDAFIAKLDAGGTLVWARTFGGMDSDAAEDVASTAGGQIVVTGSFKGKVNAAGVELKSRGNEDIFLLELTDSGDLLWAKQYGHRKLDVGHKLAVDRQDNILFLGEFTDSADFGGGPLQSHGNRDVALVKLDSRGGHIWSKSFGSSLNEFGLGMAVDPAGNIAIVGSFDDSIDFGAGALRSQGESDIYVAKFDATGMHMWSRAYGANREDIAAGVGTDKYGNVVVGGWFRQKVDFGGGPLEAAEANKDGFLLKLSADGRHVWSRRFGDRDHDQIRAIAVNDAGRTAVAGVFRFSLNLGGFALESARLPDDRAPHADGFVAVFSH